MFADRLVQEHIALARKPEPPPPAPVVVRASAAKHREVVLGDDGENSPFNIGVALTTLAETPPPCPGPPRV